MNILYQHHTGDISTAVFVDSFAVDDLEILDHLVFSLTMMDEKMFIAEREDKEKLFEYSLLQISMYHQQQKLQTLLMFQHKLAVRHYWV